MLQVRASNGSSALTIVYDSIHAMVWLVTGNAAGQPVLRGIATVSGVVHDILLPADDSGYIGQFSPLKVDPSGAVWLAGSNRLVRYDPATDMLASVVLATEVVGELPGATSGSLQGTWPSGLGFLNGRTLLARANVPWLTEFDASLSVVGRIPVSTAAAGAKDLVATSAGDLLVLPWNDLCVNPGNPLMGVDDRGNLVRQIGVGGDHLYAIGVTVLVSGSPGGAALVRGSTVSSVLGGAGSYCAGHGDMATPDPRGGVTLFLRGAGPGGFSELEHVVNEQVVGVATFPPVDISNAPKPPQASALTTTSFWIDALATDTSGTSWLGVGDQLQSIWLP